MGRLQKQNAEDNQKSFISSPDMSSELKELKTLEDLANLLKSGEHLGLPGEIVVKLLELIQKSAASGKENIGVNNETNELKSKMRELNVKIEQLEKENEELKNKLTAEQQKNQKSAHNQNSEYYMNLIKDLEKSYSDKLWQLRSLSDRLEKEVCARIINGSITYYGRM